MESMDIDKETIETPSGLRENGFRLKKVSVEESGEGLPYAPENWPNPGDTWRWKVGRRTASSGYFLDRYLYLPPRLRDKEIAAGKKNWIFASKLAAERYVRSTFPSADVDTFFASFSWKIPSKHASIDDKVDRYNVLPVPSEEATEHSLSDLQSNGGGCRAGNKMCNSIVELVEDLPFAAMPCDICCTEPNFCRDCCCILCCKTVKLNHGGYSYVKCEAIVSDGFICGHVAHIECALRTYMAGTVGGTIGLDAEYYCRRCDARTDLVPHALRIIQTCKSIDSRGEIEKLLNVGISILRGSKKTEAIRTLRHVDLTLKKLKCGTSLEDIWKADEDFSAISSGASANGNATLGVTTHQNFLDNRMSLPYVLSKFTDFCSESLKLDDEIDHVLEALQIAQEAEYKLAEERLYAQKKYLQNLYQQLDKEKTALAYRTGKTSTNALLSAVLKGVDQLKQEVVKLEQMKEVYKGFGRTSKAILKEHFGLEVED